MASYTLQLYNATGKVYTFCIYNEPPKSVGLKTVAWKCRWVPAAGEIPSSASVDWTVDYGVAIRNFDQDGKNSTGLQIVNAELGKAYEVIPGPTINPTPTPDKTVEHREIKFVNNSKQALEMGIAINCNIIYTKSVENGESILTDVHSKRYYIALYRNKSEGDAITSDIVAGPIDVAFNGATKYKVTAEKCDGKVCLTKGLLK